MSPIFPSPMKDFGYDVSDFKDIDPTFGTLDDFDELIKEVHKRGENLQITQHVKSFRFNPFSAGMDVKP